MSNDDISKSYDHPLFLDELPIDDSNEALEALKLIHSENETPDSIALHYNTLAKEYLNDRNKGYLSAALSCYTKGIESDPKDIKLLSILYSNRAFIYIKLGKYVESITNSKKAIELDSNNSKAYYRAAYASFKLELFKQGFEFSQLYINKFGPITDPGFSTLYNQIESNLKIKSNNKIKSNEYYKQLNVPYSLPEGITCKNYVKDGVLHYSSIFIYDEIGVVDFVSDMTDFDTIQMHLDLMFNDNNFNGIKFDKNVVAYLETPGNRLFRIDTQSQINSVLKDVIRYDVLPVHILSDKSIQDKLDKLLGEYTII